MKVTIFGDDGRPATAVNVGKAIRPPKPAKPPKAGPGKKARRKMLRRQRKAEQARTDLVVKAAGRMHEQIRQAVAPAVRVDEFDRYLAARAGMGDPLAKELMFKRAGDAGYREYLEHVLATGTSGVNKSAAADELARLDTEAEQRAVAARQGGGRQWLAR